MNASPGPGTPAGPSPDHPVYTKFREDPATATPPFATFAIECNEGWRSRIVCEGMYGWAADWLLGILGRRPYARSPGEVAAVPGRGAADGFPPGMTPEKLEKIADYVSLLDRMTVDLEHETVTFHPPRADETEMQDDLRAWAAAMHTQVDIGRDADLPESAHVQVAMPTQADTGRVAADGDAS